MNLAGVSTRTIGPTKHCANIDPGGPVSRIKNILLIVAIMFVGAVFGGGLYESVVNAPNYNANIPESLEHYRLFMSAANPGNFFRVVAPAAQIVLLISLVLNWKRPPGRRWWLLAAFLMLVAADVITFTIHYPRNALMFTAPMNVAPDVLKQAAAEWIKWNVVRVVFVAISMVCALKALTKDRNSS
jgi:hypothetical protein